MYLDDTSYIDFETNSFKYYDTNGRMVAIELNVNERIILNLLCHNYNSPVQNIDIFKAVYGKSFDPRNDDITPLTKMISKLRSKLSKYKDFIESPKKGIFLLYLNEPPFENYEMPINVSKTGINNDSIPTNEQNFFYSITNIEEDNQASPIPLATIDFFETALSNESELGKIKSIDMAFHGGSLWLYDGKKNALLIKALDNGVRIRIIINTSSQVEAVCSHMKQTGLLYTGFNKNAKDWENFMSEHSELVEIRIAQIPLLRRAYIIEGDSNKGWANITYYSYGNYDSSKNQSMCFRNANNAYSLYIDEFNYIWNNASVPCSESNIDQDTKIPSDTVAMVKKAFSDDAPLGIVRNIDISSHSGLYWLTNTEYVKLFQQAIDSGVRFRIIINTSSINESAQYMRQPMREYLGFEECLDRWIEREKTYPSQIEVRVAEIPIMHCTCIIKGEEDNGWARVRYYTYGNYDTSRDQCLCFKNTDDSYKLYLDEFEYIWNLSIKGIKYADQVSYDIVKEKIDAFSDEAKVSFFSSILRNKECVEVNMISLLAYYCAHGAVSRLIKDRLNDDTGFVLKMILPNPENVANLQKWYVGFEEVALNSFKIFESWVKMYPGRFLLHYTDLPIADRMYINKTEMIMLVEHLSIPQDTNLSIQNIYSASTSSDIYNTFEQQFDEIWKNYSSNPNQ